MCSSVITLIRALEPANRFAELFAMPLTNSSTNLKSANKNSITNVAGFFNVAAVSASGKRLTQKIADAAKQNGD